MKMTSHILETIHSLEKERLEIQSKKSKYLPWFLITPLLVAGFTLALFNSGPAFSIAAIGSIIGALVMYSEKIKGPFKKLHQKLRRVLLQEYMENHHPAIVYNYYYEPQLGKRIIVNSGLISADIYREQDVVRGQLKEGSFYLSEIHLLDERRRNNKKQTVTIFQGLLFQIKIPGKQFPNAQIESQHGFLKRLFNQFIENKEMGFWYDTDNENAFEEKLNPLFPFIKYLIEKQGDVRIKTQGDNITLMIESDMKFLDDPKPKINNTFLNKTYYQNIGKQINSLLFIIESFMNNFTSSEIEETLELKALEVIKASERIN